MVILSWRRRSARLRRWRIFSGDAVIRGRGVALRPPKVHHPPMPHDRAHKPTTWHDKTTASWLGGGWGCFVSFLLGEPHTYRKITRFIAFARVRRCGGISRRKRGPGSTSGPGAGFAKHGTPCGGNFYLRRTYIPIRRKNKKHKPPSLSALLTPPSYAPPPTRTLVDGSRLTPSPPLTAGRRTDRRSPVPVPVRNHPATEVARGSTFFF